VQLGLDFSAHARRSDPETSKAAAGSVDAVGLALVVLESLRQHGPATAHELADRLSLQLVTVSPRLKPLEDRGKVRRAQEKRQGRTVWIAT
jgi:DNA-binding transcriptional ArsR family regulator